MKFAGVWKMWKDPFKGVSTESIRKMDIETLNSLDRRTLARAVSRLADTANKRIKRFESKGVESPAYLNVMKSGGRISTRGKTVNQLRTEFIRARNFLGMKTSTQKGYEKVKQDFCDRVEATTAQKMSISDEELNRFWRVYDKTESEISPFIKGSEQQQKMIFDVFIKNNELSEDELIKRIYQKFDIYYEEQEELNEYTSASDFYSVV